MKTCPYCGVPDRQVKAGKTEAGSQRYKCQRCGCRYTPEPKQAGYDDRIRKIAVRMCADEINFRRIARHLQVHHQSVINWVNAYVAQLPDDPPMPTQLDVIEADELFSFIEQKKNIVYLITLVARASSCFVEWAVSPEREMALLQSLIDGAPGGSVKDSV